jgi:hypothetical protein
MKLSSLKLRTINLCQCGYIFEHMPGESSYEDVTLQNIRARTDAWGAAGTPLRVHFRQSEQQASSERSLGQCPVYTTPVEGDLESGFAELKEKHINQLWECGQEVGR